jgi:cytochrome c oxidase assembly protein subunit 15
MVFFCFYLKIFKSKLFVLITFAKTFVMQQKTSKLVGYWLILGAVLVITMVVIGGITRLTHSGLSMVKWHPISGIVPPLNTAEWQVEFNHYKTSPEYIQYNYQFTLNDFKSIFWWEFIHRFIGRIIGIIFLIPFLWFYFTKKLEDKKLRKRLVFIFLLGGLQGFIGWFMVSSGLVDRPSVSHFRLALHLSTALFLCAFILWTAFPILIEEKVKNNFYPFLNKLLKWMLGLLSLQIIFGAFTAGLKAGYIYPTYPKMGSEWLPQAAKDAFHQTGLLSLVDYPILVQFIHRWLGALVVLVFIVYVVKSKSFKLNATQHRWNNYLLGMVLLQFALGILTLINVVPVSLGVIHQLGAVVLLAVVLRTLYNNRKPETV